jgi:hypothetical protein
VCALGLINSRKFSSVFCPNNKEATYHEKRDSNRNKQKPKFRFFIPNGLVLYSEEHHVPGMLQRHGYS